VGKNFTSKVTEIIRKKNQKYGIIVILAFLIIINFITSFYLFETFEHSIWRSDDALHISAAQSFAKGENFELNFNLAFTDRYNDINIILEMDPSLSSSYSRAILYHAFLGSFYYVFDTQPVDFVLHASVFSFILSSTFVVLFFFLIQKYFNAKIAIISSVFVLLIPFFAWESVRALPTMLAYIFIISSLFFLEKKPVHYFMFGFFIALSHMTHPVGIVFGFSYVVYLLISREIKGAVITFFIWNVFLLPHYFRSYYFWKDIGVGLYLPFSNKISSHLEFLPHVITEDGNIVDGIISNNNFSLDLSSYFIYEPFLILFLLFKEFEFIGMGYIIIIIFFSIFLYFVMTKINQKRSIDKIGDFKQKYFYFKNRFLQPNFILVIFMISVLLLFTIIITIDLVAGSFGGGYFFNPNTLYFTSGDEWSEWRESFFSNQPTDSFSPIIGIVLMISLLIFVSILKWKYKNFFKIKSKYQSFIICYLIISLICYYYIAISQAEMGPANRHLIIILIVLIPVGISAFNKVINLSKIISSRRKVLSILFCTLLFLPVGIQFISGIDYFHDNGNSKILSSLAFEKHNDFHIYLRDNYDDDLVYASNIPAELFLRTGFSSVGIPSNLDCVDMDSYLNHFKPDYYIIYPNNIVPVNQKIFEHTPNISFISNKHTSDIINEINSQQNEKQIQQIKIIKDFSTTVGVVGTIENYVLDSLIEFVIFSPNGSHATSTTVANGMGEYKIPINITDNWVSGKYVIMVMNNGVIDQKIQFLVQNENLDGKFHIYEIMYAEEKYEQKISLLKSHNFLQDSILDENKISKSWESLKQIAKNNFDNNNLEKSLSIYEQMNSIEPFDYEIINGMLDIIFFVDNNENKQVLINNLEMDNIQISNFPINNLEGKTQKEIFDQITNSILFNQECFDKKLENETEK
jgi:hypothetical protein